MKRTIWILLIVVLGLALCLLLCLDRLLIQNSNPTVPTVTATEQTATTELATEQAEETTQHSTQAPTSLPDPDNEYIGSLYTRMELAALENENKGYGPGAASGGGRPPYAQGDQKKYGAFGANFIAPDNGCIYLTFDCGYEYQNLTSSILDTLKEKNVKAVFFITMSYAKKNPELVKRMIDEGHSVGNHSNTHPEMPELTVDEMVWEVMSLHNYVLETFGYEMTLFRPPTGAFSTRSLAVVQSLGYKTVHWSFAYADWDTGNQPEPQKALEKITSSHHSGAIYLLHAVSRTNAAVLGEVIDFLQNRGYMLMRFQ